ncbi:MAG: oxygen-dependent coproporphyrinogen oxidase [Bacteroidia bacterium]
MFTKDSATEFFIKLQNEICYSLEQVDGKAKFHEDIWEREGGGGGRTRVMQNGNVIEKGGVNFSAVYGKLPENIKKALQVNEEDFFATGVSIVMHPENPFVPIIHMNVRYFELSDKTRWFGGGIDLTPHYINTEQAKYFHQQLKNTCDKFDPDYYPKFKKWADDYFFIKHRGEARGIGGIFFDRLSDNSTKTIEEIFEFVKAVGETFVPTYCHLIEWNKKTPYTQQHKDWQMIRRGRYVEFNLVYDKGTKFGLDTNGRIESILMSLPLQAGWPYNFIPEPQSEEEFTTKLLKNPTNWI